MKNISIYFSPDSGDKSDYDLTVPNFTVEMEPFGKIKPIPKEIYSAADFPMKFNAYSFSLLNVLRNIVACNDNYHIDVLVYNDEFEVHGITDIEMLDSDEFDDLIEGIKDTVRDIHNKSIEIVLRDESNHNSQVIAVNMCNEETDKFMFMIDALTKICEIREELK